MHNSVCKDVPHYTGEVTMSGLSGHAEEALEAQIERQKAWIERQARDPVPGLHGYSGQVSLCMCGIQRIGSNRKHAYEIYTMNIHNT